jgi:predicted kinase
MTGATRRDLPASFAQPRRQFVIQMHGEPGSGKSTVARELGARIGAIILDKDVIKAALLRVGIVEQQAAAGAYEVFFAQAHALVAAGHSIILDNPVYWETVERRWFEISDAADSPHILIECVCADRDEIARRLATRDALESQPRNPLDLRKHPGSAPTRFQPRITLDTTHPLTEIVGEAIASIQRAVDAPRASTGQRLAATPP